MVFGITLVHACRCLPPGEPKYEIEHSAAVFSGKVIGMKKIPGMLQQVTFKVFKTWKGPKKKQIVVTTTTDPAGCGFEFEKGKKYLVYASAEVKRLQVSLCSRTLPLEMADDDIKGFK